MLLEYESIVSDDVVNQEGRKTACSQLFFFFLCFLAMNATTVSFLR